MWPGLQIVHGRPRHPQSQGSVERSNGDIQDMLNAWMDENKSRRWSIGCSFVQFQKNTALNSGIKTSPYEALFGQPAQIGLSTFATIPKNIRDTIETEEKLIELLKDNETNVGAGADEDTETEYAGADRHNDTNAGAGAETENSGEGGGTETDVDAAQADIEARKLTIKIRRKKVKEAQNQQASTMLRRSKKMLNNEVEIGDNVLVFVPEFDKNRSCTRNVLAVVIKKIEDRVIVATEYGGLNGALSKNQYSVCKRRLLTLQDVKEDPSLSIREIVAKSNVTGGQGFNRCNCSSATQCKTKRCKCRKNNLLCGSHCHNSLTCSNKL